MHKLIKSFSKTPRNKPRPFQKENHHFAPEKAPSTTYSEYAHEATTKEVKEATDNDVKKQPHPHAVCLIIDNQSGCSMRCVTKSMKTCYLCLMC